MNGATTNILDDNSAISCPLDEYLAQERVKHRVLSIQSHVVSGYVGNKCALFPLQLHGFEVDSINSVQYSNHTQYPNGARGQRLNQEDLEQLFEGLRQNELHKNYSHILTGYCGDATFLRKMADIIRECRNYRPDIIYVCDPVLGDNNSYYVPRELCDIYRNEVLPLADVITPNAFELGELGGGLPVQNEEQCLKAIDQIHRTSPNLRAIVCTSGLTHSTSTQNQQPIMHCYASEKISTGIENGPIQFRVFRFNIPLIKGTFVGTGDLFSALLLVWYEQTGGELCSCVRATIASMQAVLRRTIEQAHDISANPSMADCELRLIQSRMDLLLPRAEEIHFDKL